MMATTVKSGNMEGFSAASGISRPTVSRYIQRSAERKEVDAPED